MITYFEKRHNSLSYRILSAFIAFTFIFSLVLPPGYAQFIPQTLLNLPAPGAMVTASPAFTPALINGITIHPENPLQFDFIVNTGDSKLAGQELTKEANKLIKYFLAALTVPEKELWVNLSPYEKDRIIPPGFGHTEMGRDLLAQDYILKQLTASLMYPEKELGKKFWDKIYKQAREKYGTTEIPMDTFNKVWIVPEDAVIYEQDNSAFVVKSHLKVMLEEDYMAVSHQSSDVSHQNENLTTEDRRLTTQIIKEIILPEIEKEVNTGETFANLRQIYNSTILAAWYKMTLKESLLGQVYVDQNKTKGIDTEDKQANEKIYSQYLEAFKKGVYNYIKEDYDEAAQEVIPRKYFSGGANLTLTEATNVNAKPALSRFRRGTNGVLAIIALGGSLAAGGISSAGAEAMIASGLTDSSYVQVVTDLQEFSPKVDQDYYSKLSGQISSGAVFNPSAPASSPVTQGEREQILKEDWKYYSEKFNGYLSRLRGRDEGAKSDLIDFLNDVGKTMDEEMADFPVEARYPLLKAAALLGKSDRQVLLNIIKENRSKFKSDLADAIPMMFDLVPPGWLEKRAPQMRGRVIYTVSPENLLLAGGLGYVMQVHEKFMRELGARVVSIEPMYKYRKDLHGALQPLDYEADFGIQDKREIATDSIDVGGYVTDVRHWKGKTSTGKEAMFIEEIPREGEALRYTNTVYDYHNFGNRSWEEFSAFFGKAVVQLIRAEEERRKDEERGGWKPAVVWGNDSQAAGAMALIVQEKNRARDDDRSVFRDIYPVFTTHTFGNRQPFGLDQIDWVLGQLLGLQKKYYSAGIRFNIIDMASLAIRLVDGAGGLVNMVSRKHKVVLDRNQFDPDAKTVAITNGDDLSRAWGLVEDMYRDIYKRELNDADDLTWQEARSVVEEAVRHLNVSFVDEGVNDLGLDPRKPIVSYAGRLINVKVSPFRTFTERNIGRLVADGFNVVLFGRLQNYKESMDLADHYRGIEAWIETQKKADPAATAGWGSFVFKGQYNDAQKQLMLIASNLVALDSDDETGTSEWTEVNGAIALSWILASPWRLRAPDSRKVILGEGILAEANEKGINLVVPEVPQNVLVEEINVMRAKRYNRQAKDIISEVEDAYYGAMKSKLSEAKSDPETFYSGVIKSAKIAKIVNGYNTAAAYLTQWSKNLDVQSQWLEEARQVSKNFVAGLNAEQKQQLLNGERNGIRNFVFHVPPIASISVHERLFESGKGLRSFRIIKGAIEAEVWDGTLGHLRNGDYVKYIDGLTKGLQGQEEVLTWLNGLVADDELSWYKKDLIFSEFVETLINGLENKRKSESASSPVGEIKEVNASSTPEEITVVRDLIQTAAAGQNFKGDPEAVTLARTLMYEGKQMRFEDGFLVSFQGQPIFKYLALSRGPSQQPEIHKEIYAVNGKSPIHFAPGIIYLEIAGGAGHLLRMQKGTGNEVFYVKRISSQEFDREKEFASSPVWTRAELKNTLSFLEWNMGSIRTDSGLDRGHERQIYYSSTWKIHLSYDSFASHQTWVTLVDNQGRDRYTMRYPGSLALAKDEHAIRKDLKQAIEEEMERKFPASSPVTATVKHSRELSIKVSKEVNPRKHGMVLTAITFVRSKIGPNVQTWIRRPVGERPEDIAVDIVNELERQNFDFAGNPEQFGVLPEFVNQFSVRGGSDASSPVSLKQELIDQLKGEVEPKRIYMFMHAVKYSNIIDDDVRAVANSQLDRFHRAYGKNIKDIHGTELLKRIEATETKNELEALLQEIKQSYDNGTIPYKAYDELDWMVKVKIWAHNGKEAFEEIEQANSVEALSQLKMRLVIGDLVLIPDDLKEAQRRVAEKLTSASSPVSFRGISPKAGEKLFDMMPLTEEERSNIEVVTIETGRGVLHERQAFVLLLGGRQLKVYLRPKTVRALEDAVKAGNSLEKTIGEGFDRLDNEPTDIDVVLDEVRMAGEGVDVSSSPMTGDTFRKGGIDLNPALLDLQIRRDGNGVPLPLPMQPIENMHIEGFLPIIINVTPVTNLPFLLGLADTEQDADEITPAMKAREPEEISALN